MTTYYRIEDASPKAYDMIHGGTILAIDGQKEWLLTSIFCGMDKMEGGQYRDFVYDHRQHWPKEAINAIDYTSQWKAILDDAPCDAFTSDFSAKDVRKLLAL